MRILTTTLHRTFDAVDRWLDAFAERNRTTLRHLWIATCFVLLWGGVAWHAHATGFGAVVARAQGAVPGGAPMVAVLTGTAAIGVMALLAAIGAFVQRTFIDRWQFVRPGRKPAEIPRWLLWIHVPLGVLVFFVIAGIASEGRSIRIAGDRSLALILGWWVGGTVVLKFFWMLARRRDGIETP